jgi:hypothetical protein
LALNITRTDEYPLHLSGSVFSLLPVSLLTRGVFQIILKAFPHHQIKHREVYPTPMIPIFLVLFPKD